MTAKGGMPDVHLPLLRGQSNKVAFEENAFETHFIPVGRFINLNAQPLSGLLSGAACTDSCPNQLFPGKHLPVYPVNSTDSRPLAFFRCIQVI